MLFIESSSTDPYYNLALEDHIFSGPGQTQDVFMLWRNDRSVIIGKYQNAASEVRMEYADSHGIRIARRLSGGGAVYHDGGNINFSFIAPPSLYNQAKHFEVISTALKDFGIEAEVSGRNDLLANGRKFSGNAFSKGRNHWLHHGTLLIGGNVNDLSLYLRVKPSKLHKHGVASVQSRVVNLSELNPSLTSDNIAPHLIAAFEKVYGKKTETIDFDEIVKTPGAQNLIKKYSSEEWLYGRWKSFTAQRSHHFDWGEVELSFTVDETTHTITDTTLATDALDVTLADKLRTLLIGASTSTPPQTTDPLLSDLISLIYSW